MFNIFAKYKQRKQEELMRLVEERTIQALATIEQNRLDELEIAKIKKEEEDKLAKIAKEEEDRLAEIAIVNRRKKAKESNAPYLEIIADNITEQGLKLDMDWNKPMIKYLKKSGFKGNSEEEIVFKYMAAINREVQLDEIAENYIGTEDSDDSIVSEDIVDEK